MSAQAPSSRAGVSPPPFDAAAELGELYPFHTERWLVPAREGVPAATLSYVDQGPRGAPPVLMLHGNPTWSFYYRGLIGALQDRFRCLVPDHIGAGLSDKPQDYPYTLATHVRNVVALVEHLDLRDVTLIVHDWGGAIGMGWATLQPERVGRVVVLNTAAFKSERIPFSINVCRIPVFGNLAIRGCNAFVQAAVIRAVERPLSREVKRGYLLPYGSWKDRVGHLRFVHDIPLHEGIESWGEINRIEAGLAQLAETPALVCWGGKDWCFDDSFLATWKEKLPHARCERFADAGHFVLEDAGERVLAELEAFLAEHGPAADRAPESEPEPEQ